MNNNFNTLAATIIKLTIIIINRSAKNENNISSPPPANPKATVAGIDLLSGKIKQNINFTGAKNWANIFRSLPAIIKAHPVLH